MYDGMSLYRAVVTASDSVTGDINVLIPSVLGATETVPITKLGRVANANGSWPVPAVGDQVVVAVEDDRFSNVYIVVTDLPEQVEQAPDGVLSVTGTPNQVLVNTAGQHVTLYLPQSISPSSNVVFGNVTATSASAGTLSTPNLTASTAAVTTVNATTVNASTSNTSGTTTTNGLAVTSGTITTPASTANLFTGSTLVNVGSSGSTVTLGNDLVVTGDLIVSGTTTSTSATTVTGGTVFASNTIATIPVTVVGFSGQVANLTEWKNSAGTVTAKVSAAGVIDGTFTGSGAGLTGVEWANIASKPSPVITLGNHATGSVTLTSLTSGTLNVTIVNDSHTHDTRYYTETESDTRFFNVTGDSISGVLTSTVTTGTAPLSIASTSLVTNLNSDLLDGQHGAYYRDWTNVTSKPSPVITLGQDASGSVTLTELGSATLNVTVLDDSHTHDTRYYTETESDTRFINATGDSMTGVLTSTVSTGTAPFSVTSTTVNTNMNADLLDGQHGSWYQDWANITNKPDPVVTLSGDVGGTATMTDLGSITISTTIQPNSVALGTDTTGQYARTLTGTANRVTVTTPNTDDGTDYTLNLPQDIHTTANPQFATANLVNTVNSNVVLTAQGAATQSADLQQWKTPSAVLAKVDTEGKATFKEVYVDTSTTGNTYRIGMLGGTPGNTSDPSKLYIVANSAAANTTPSHASVTTPFYADSNGRFSIGDSLFFDPSDGQTFGRLTVIGRIRGAIENTPIVPSDSGQFTVDQVVISSTTPNQTAVVRTTAQHTFNVGDTVVVAGIDGVSNASAANGAWQITAKTTVSPFTFTIGGISGATNGTYSVTGTARVREMTFGLHAPLNGSPAGLGIRLDESNYWFVNNRFRVGSTGSSMEWDGASLQLSGAVIANSGDFQTAVTVNNGTMKIGKGAGGTGLHGIYVSANNYWYDNGAFRIGGTTGIVYTGSGNITIGSTVEINGSAIVNGSITGASITIGTGFAVTNTGVMTATSGTVGGWTLGLSTLVGTGTSGSVTLDKAGDITVVSSTAANQVLRISSSNVNYRLWVGNAFPNLAPFSVSNTGSIKATAGTIGGWTLGDTALTGGSTTLNSNGSLTAGTNFSVSTTGVLNAQSAVISGAVTANSLSVGGTNGINYTGTGNVTIGTGVSISGALSSPTGNIGGFTIGNEQLYAGSGSTYVSVSTGASTSGYAFWAGDPTPGSAEFNVTNAGQLNASNASITGAITANSFTLKSGANDVGSLSTTSIPTIFGGSVLGSALSLFHQKGSGLTPSYLAWTTDATTPYPTVALFGPELTGSVQPPGYLSITSSLPTGDAVIRLLAPKASSDSALFEMGPTGFFMQDFKSSITMSSSNGVLIDHTNFGVVNISTNGVGIGVRDDSVLPVVKSSLQLWRSGSSWSTDLTSNGVLTIKSTLSSITSNVPTGQKHVYQVNNINLYEVTGTGASVNGTLAATTFSGSGASLTSIPNSATTATSANTLSAIVARDGSGDFSAGIITASAAVVSGNITFPIATDVGLRNSGTGASLSYFHLDRSGSGNSQWKTKTGSSALIDADTTTFRLSGGGTTVGTFNSSGFSVGATAATGIGLKKRSTDSVMLLSYGQSDNYVLATNGGGSSFLRCGASSATIFVVGATSVAQFAPNGDFHPIPDNTYKLGWSEGRWSAVWSATATIQTSDARTKTDVVNSPLGLSFINRLRPVQYRYIVGSNVVVDNVYNPETGGNDPITEPVPGVRLHAGLIAQEVKQALDAEEAEDFGGWLLTDKDDPDSEQALRYEEFIAPLIRAVQELSAEVATLKTAFQNSGL